MRYFLGIVSILGFFYYVILLNRRNNLILQPFMDVGMIGRTTLKPSCTFMLISLSLFS